MDPSIRALTVTIIPESSELDETGWRAVEAAIENSLASRPRSQRAQFGFFLRLLGWISVVRFGRSLTSLDAGRCRRLLASIERSPLLLLRRGFWGLRTLIFLGYWSRPEAAAAIGYRPSRDGWAARR